MGSRDLKHGKVYVLHKTYVPVSLIDLPKVFKESFLETFLIFLPFHDDKKATETLKLHGYFHHPWVAKLSTLSVQ